MSVITWPRQLYRPAITVIVGYWAGAGTSPLAFLKYLCDLQTTNQPQEAIT